jgi:uncharacterized protein YjdB
MSKMQVSFHPTTKVATLQTQGDAPPAGTTVIGTFFHDEAGDEYQAGAVVPANHVTWHHVRDMLYKIGEWNMQIVSIVVDTDYVALVSILVAPATATKAVAQTQQLTVTPTPAGASNAAVVWSTNKPTKASVSTTGLVTVLVGGADTVVITATSVDGAKVSTHTLTIT